MIVEFTDMDALVSLIDTSELKVLAVKNNECFRQLYENATSSGAIRISGNGKPVNICLYPVMYSYQGKDSCFIASRMAAVQAIFRRWASFDPDTRQVQSLFGSRKFTKYCREEGYLDADWIVVAE